MEATRSAAAGGLPAQPPAANCEADAVGQLSAELAVTTGKLQAAQEQVAQLEKLLKVWTMRFAIKPSPNLHQPCMPCYCTDPHFCE